MEIRKKLTYYYILIVALIITLSSLAIYFSAAEFRKEEFYERLTNKAKTVAQLLTEVDEVDANLLRKIETNNPSSLPNERIIIINYLNEIVYSSDDENHIRINNDLLNDIRLSGNLRYKHESYEVLGLLFAEKYDRMVVIAAAEDIYGLRKLKNLRSILVIVFITSLLLVFVSGRIFSNNALNPILKVIEQVDRITFTNLNLRVDEGNGKDEIARLAITFNNMLRRLETAFKVQKNFIANASHELRTPLTVITGQLEVLRMKERSNDDYKKSMESILEDIKNLNSISNRLLLLAQTSSDFSEINFSKIRIDEALWQARNELLKRNPHYQVNVEMSNIMDDESMFLIYGNRELIKTAFTNLIDNGCKYSGDSKLSINITANITKEIILTFTDKGIGIDKDELKLIFKPFYRAKNVTNTKGHGIGLSLVENIVILHKGSIDVKSEINTGTSFIVRFPLYKF